MRVGDRDETTAGGAGLGPAPEQPTRPGTARLRLVVASANPDKAAEIAEILEPVLAGRVELLPRPAEVPEVEEDGGSFEANARLKARALCAATGLAAVADDSGLEVDALDGAPGVDSAYFAGPSASYAENVARLLADLEGIEERQARFRTVALVAFPDGGELTAEGRCPGQVAAAPRGGGGFGYDPVFVADDAGGRTFGELAPEEKHARSARGRAFRALAAQLADRLAGEGAAGSLGQ